MTDSRLGRIWGLVAEQAAWHGGRVSADDVCAAAMVEVQVTGAWLSAASGTDAGHLMRVTDEVSQRLSELETTLGEGPSFAAIASGGPALAPDLKGNRGGAGRCSRRPPATRERRRRSRSRWRSGRS